MRFVFVLLVAFVLGVFSENTFSVIANVKECVKQAKGCPCEVCECCPGCVGKGK